MALVPLPESPLLPADPRPRLRSCSLSLRPSCLPSLVAAAAYWRKLRAAAPSRWLLGFFRLGDSPRTESPPCEAPSMPPCCCPGLLIQSNGDGSLGLGAGTPSLLSGSSSEGRLKGVSSLECQGSPMPTTVRAGPTGHGRGKRVLSSMNHPVSTVAPAQPEVLPGKKWAPVLTSGSSGTHLPGRYVRGILPCSCGQPWLTPSAARCGSSLPPLGARSVWGLHPGRRAPRPTLGQDRFLGFALTEGLSSQAEGQQADSAQNPGLGLLGAGPPPSHAQQPLPSCWRTCLGTGSCFTDTRRWVCENVPVFQSFLRRHYVLESFMCRILPN